MADSKLRFKRSDGHVVEELKSAENLLRSGSSRAVPDQETAELLADVLKTWIFVGGLDPDMLNRCGGQETVLLARDVNRRGEFDS